MLDLRMDCVRSFSILREIIVTGESNQQAGKMESAVHFGMYCTLSFSILFFPLYHEV